MLQEVLNYKRAVPMNGDEIPHRKGMGSGRYPQNATEVFIKLLKNLQANASSVSADTSQLKIHAKADVAARRRYSRRGQHFKRTHVLVELK
jgi:large subunit ribosomal protein L22